MHGKAYLHPRDGPPSDVYSIEDMAGLQQLWMRSPEAEEAVRLTGLGSLRELTYTNSWTLRHSPLLISADAALTKLALHGHWVIVLPISYHASIPV